MVSFTVPTELLHPATGNQNIIAMATYANNLWSDFLKKTKNNATIFYNISEIDLIDFATVKLVVGYGGEVEGLPMYIKMSKTFAETTTVPEYLPNSSITEWETTTQKFWIDYTPIHIYNDIVVVKEGTNWFKYFLWSQYVKLSKIDGINILTKKEFQQLQKDFIIE